MSQDRRQASGEDERVELAATVLLNEVPQWEGCPAFSINEARRIAEKLLLVLECLDGTETRQHHDKEGQIS